MGVERGGGTMGRGRGRRDVEVREGRKKID